MPESAGQRKAIMPMVEEYLRSNADRSISLVELEKELSRARSSISGACRALLRKQPDRISTQKGGWYRYHSTPISGVKVSPDRDLLLVFVQEVEDGKGTRIFRDDDSNKMYAVREVTFAF